MYDCSTFICEMYENMMFLICLAQSLKSTIFIILTFVYVDPVDQAAHATRNNGGKKEQYQIDVISNLLV